MTCFTSFLFSNKLADNVPLLPYATSTNQRMCSRLHSLEEQDLDCKVDVSPAIKFETQKTIDIFLTACFYVLLVVFYIYRQNIHQDCFLRRVYMVFFAFRLFTLRFSYKLEISRRGKDWAIWRNIVYLLWAAISIKEMAFFLGYY